MKTLSYIKDLLLQYKEEISYANDCKERDSIRIAFVSLIKNLQYRFPYLLYQLCPKTINIQDAKAYMENLGEKVMNNYIPIIPALNNFTDIIGDEVIQTPCFTYFEVPMTPINDLKKLNEVLFRILLSLPIKKVKLTFIDLQCKFQLDSFYKQINPLLYNHTPITEENELRELIKRLKERIFEVKQKYGDYRTYCISNKEIPMPYEFIILLSDNKPKSDYDERNIAQKLLTQIARNGYQAGVYFILYGAANYSMKYNNHRFLRYRTNGNELDSYYDIEEPYYSINYLQHGNYVYYECDGNYFSYPKNYSLYRDKIKKKYINDICRCLENTPLIHTLINEKIRISALYGKEKIINELAKKLYFNNLPQEATLAYKKEEAEKIKNELEEFGIKVRVDYVDVTDMSAKLPTLFTCTSLSENENLLKACIDYINKEAIAEEKLKAIAFNFSQEANISYIEIINRLSVPVGVDNKNEVCFILDGISHTHAFIIGQSGSGKSIFLHNIIGNAILKYAPEDLQLYLLDFKLGGVEFNRYKDVKHVKALLVDNSDQQITLEILRELRERMVERGKKLRDTGVSNLSEYNRMNKDATMPQILLIVDECHEMFRVGSDIPRAVSNEISEIVTKIAKEGRSQGVHLVLATQTLSGTEISNEILNNISDHYLLKCAPADSERMAERSSEITGSLRTGEVYYHHVERQLKFQAYYTGKKEAEELIQLAKEKSASHPSNNMFYFSGAQMFKLEKSILHPKTKYPAAYLGKSVSIHLNDVNITLRKDYSENILLFGINDEEQVTRTTFNLLLSLLMTTRKMEQPVQFKVINCLSNEKSVYVKLLESLEENSFCEIVEGRKDRGIFLKELAEHILNGKAGDMILFILGQERFRELKIDIEIENKQETGKDNGDDAFGFGNFSFGGDNSSAQASTFKQALETILDKGAEQGVHVVMQLDKPSNFLFSDYVSPKFVYQKFKHLVMLKSEETASTVLNLNENIRLESLSRDAERLRAYYYSEESDTYTLFTPYMGLNEKEMLKLLKNE